MRKRSSVIARSLRSVSSHLGLSKTASLPELNRETSSLGTASGLASPSHHILDYFECCLWSKELRQGTLYVCRDYLLFNGMQGPSDRLVTRIQIEFDAVMSVKREDGFMDAKAGIRVFLVGESVLFVNVIDRERCLECILRAWNRCLEERRGETELSFVVGASPFEAHRAIEEYISKLDSVTMQWEVEEADHYRLVAKREDTPMFTIDLRTHSHFNSKVTILSETENMESLRQDLLSRFPDLDLQPLQLRSKSTRLRFSFNTTHLSTALKLIAVLLIIFMIFKWYLRPRTIQSELDALYAEIEAVQAQIRQIMAEQEKDPLKHKTNF